MKKVFLSLFWAGAATLMAQNVTFDTQDYKAIGVYDTWEQSPFRTGALKGNAAVITNHLTDVDEITGEAANATANILAVQRSRFGSNTFGVRIDLKEPFVLPTTTKYFHVLINKPTEGRVMLVGLGKRQERAGQSPEAEQFWVLSTSKIEAGKWCDAVFPVKGAAGIDIYSLVLIPDCESPHNLTEDFACYVDEIVLNDESVVRIQRETYPVNFDRDATWVRTDRGLRGVKLQAQTLTVATSMATTNRAYNDCTDKTFTALIGQTLTPTFTYTGSWMSGYVYIDYGQDGKFTPQLNDDGTPKEGSDLVTYSFYQNKNSNGASVGNGNVLNPPSFVIPESVKPGFYRMRYKVDWNSIDAGGCPGPDNFILNNGGGIVDLRLNVHAENVNVNEANRNGEMLSASGEKLSGYSTPFGKAFTIKAVPERGFIYNGVRIRHGYNLGGDSLVYGMAQYADTIITRDRFNENDEFTIPADLVDGDIEIEGLFVEDPDKVPEEDTEGYKLIFNDEFNQADGSQPDDTKWSSSERRTAAWNRYIADDPSVCFIQDGALVCRAIRTDDPRAAGVPMITGARETKGKFSFTYGKVYVRLKTNPHVGNFPAAWMMPEPPAESWPNGGEIDIFETIDTQQRAWHTIHSNWTYNLKNTNSPKSSFDEPVTVDEWHVYGFQWEPFKLTWTVDGEVVGTYEKSTDLEEIAQGQWPFGHPYYIILNQSVGMGTWAANPDLDFTYETRFDYVRVYQKEGVGILETPSDATSSRPLYDLQGRRLTDKPAHGIFIQGGKKLVR